MFTQLWPRKIQFLRVEEEDITVLGIAPEIRRQVWLLLWQEFSYHTQCGYQTVRSRTFHKEYHITPVEVSKDVSAARWYSPAIHVARRKIAPERLQDCTPRSVLGTRITFHNV